MQFWFGVAGDSVSELVSTPPSTSRAALLPGYRYFGAAGFRMEVGRKGGSPGPNK